VADGNASGLFRRQHAELDCPQIAQILNSRLRQDAAHGFCLHRFLLSHDAVCRSAPLYTDSRARSARAQARVTLLPLLALRAPLQLPGMRLRLAFQTAGIASGYYPDPRKACTGGHAFAKTAVTPPSRPFGTEIAMTDQRFVHLHCHSHYSLLDGANRIPEL